MTAADMDDSIKQTRIRVSFNKHNRPGMDECRFGMNTVSYHYCRRTPSNTSWWQEIMTKQVWQYCNLIKLAEVMTTTVIKLLDDPTIRAISDHRFGNIEDVAWLFMASVNSQCVLVLVCSMFIFSMYFQQFCWNFNFRGHFLPLVWGN